MVIRKCDNCQVEIVGEPINAGIGYFCKVELCRNCAKPIVAFFNKRKLLQKELIQKGFQKNSKKVS